MAVPVRSAGVRRNAVFALAAEGSRALFAAALVLVITRVLGPEDYGLYALAYSIGALALLPSDFGISPSSARFIAERREDRDRAVGVFSDALRAKLLLAGTISVVLGAGAGLIADLYDEAGLADPLRITAATLFVQSVFTLCAASFVALGRTSLQAVLYASEGLLELVLVATAAVVTGGVVEAAAGRTAAFALGALVGLVLVVRLLGRRVAPRVRRRSTVRLVSYAGVLFLVDVAWALLTTLDVLLVGAYLGTESVGLFEAPLRIVGFVMLPGMAVASAVAPRLAGEDGRAALGTLAVALRGLLIVGCAAGAVALAWAAPLIDLLLGPDYAESASVLRILAPYLPLGLIAPLATIAVNYIGRAGRRVPLVLGALAVNAGLNVVLIPAVGIVGAGIASLVAFAFYVPAHLVFLRSSVGLALRPLALTGIRALLAAAALAGVLALLDPTGLDLAAIAGAAVLGPIAFVGTLVLTRELTVAELRALPAALRTLRGGR